jgi:hypothetical protein
MMFLGRMVHAVFDVRGVISYFNPNGEVLRDRASFRWRWDRCTRQSLMPLPLWINIRFFHLDGGILFMDTVGNAQLAVRDVEAVFPAEKYQPDDVYDYLCNVILYLLEKDGEMRTGNVCDGPKENTLSWRVEALDRGLVAPPRRVLRLYPNDARAAVYKALTDGGA